MSDGPKPLDLEAVSFFDPAQEPPPEDVDVVDPDEPQGLTPIAERQTTDSDVLKATVILRALMDAGLKLPFDFNPDAAKYLWATRLKTFSLDVLTEAVTDWTSQKGHDWPSLGDIETCARYVIGQRTREETATEVGDCDMCGQNMSGPGYVRVEDRTPEGQEPYKIPVGKDQIPTEVETHHMAPCPNPAHKIMVKRRELYDRNHFTMEHLEKGGCPGCWEYTPSLAHRAKAARRKAS